MTLDNQLDGQMVLFDLDKQEKEITLTSEVVEDEITDKISKIFDYLPDGG